MIDLYPAVLLADLQGFAESLALSGDAHRLTPTRLLGGSDQALAFDVAVHVGTLDAVIIPHRTEILRRADRWLGSLAAELGGDESRHYMGSLL